MATLLTTVTCQCCCDCCKRCSFPGSSKAQRPEPNEEEKRLLARVYGRKEAPTVMEAPIPVVMQIPQIIGPEQQAEFLPPADPEPDLGSATAHEADLDAEQLKLLKELEGCRLVPIEEEQSGEAYWVQKPRGRRVAVFKPADGSHFVRRGLEPSEAWIREQSVYIVDRHAGGRAAVPVTAPASLSVTPGSPPRLGSVQAYMPNLGNVSGLGNAHDLKEATDVVSQADCEALALLAGAPCIARAGSCVNTPCLGRSLPHGLGAIDHGCCIPPYHCLVQAVFSAWWGRRQLKEPPAQDTRASLTRALFTEESLVTELRQVGLSEASIVTVRLLTRLAYVAIEEKGLTLQQLADLVLRETCEDGWRRELSWLEQRLVRVLQGANGLVVRVEADENHEHQVLVEGPENLEVEWFLRSMMELFRQELP